MLMGALGGMWEPEGGGGGRTVLSTSCEVVILGVRLQRLTQVAGVLASFLEPDAQAVALSTSLCVQAVSDEALGTDRGHQEEMWPGLSRGTASNPDRFGRRSFG